jgi:tetratricopeptide (TPR) repeat protein
MSTSVSSPPSASPSADELCDKAVRLQIAGGMDVAEEIYRAILQAEPSHAAANHCLGLLLLHVRRPAEGLPHLLTALNGNPEIPDYWLGYLESLLLIGKMDEAKSTLALGRQHGLKGPAVEDYAKRLEASVERKPTRASRRRDAQLARGDEDALLAMINQGRFVEARALARSMTERHPERGLGWKVLGALLWSEKDQDSALTAMRTAVRLLPKDAEALRNLGAALNEVSLFDEAEICLQRALLIDPTSIPANNDLGENNWLQGRPAEAEALFRSAIALTAGHPATATHDKLYTGLLFTMSCNPGVDADSLFAEHCRVGEFLEGPRRGSRSRHLNNPDPQRRLQVGFVSGDLWNHSVANFIEPVLAQLRNFQSLELHAYYNKDFEDAVTRRLRGYIQHWRPVLRLSDQQLANQIMDDQIDILIDLSGHTSLNRLRTFARKPAPIQASWIGYPGTTGMQAMDYYLADRHFLPPGQFDRHFTEKLVYLPANVPFQPYESAPPVNALPALATGSICFGSFNRVHKVNAATIELWSRLLRALPEATMVIGGIPLDSHRNKLIDQFVAEGIGRERLTFFPRCSMRSYLELHHQVDVCLDTYPYTGGTTTIHAIWMGVPTLTVAGPTPAARQGAAILGQLDLNGFIATGVEDFVAKGLYWAKDLAALAKVRAELRSRWQQSPARQPDLIAASLEQALRHMWTRWCAGLPPESF